MEKLDLILESIKNIETRLNLIEQVLNKNCSKMEDHINFVESTYNIVRKPLNYLKNKVEGVMGLNQTVKELPEIKNN